jgi:DNA polymerase-3 subunit beta
MLDQMINKTSYAVSTDLTRPSLCGVLWEIKKGTLGMIATDGHRLAKVELPGAVSGGEEKDVIVSPKALNIYRSLLTETRCTFRRENHITDSVTASFTATPRGTLPDYNQVMPEEHACSQSAAKNHRRMQARRFSPAQSRTR